MIRPRSSEFETDKPVKDRFWPCLEPFSIRKSVKPFKLSPPRSTAGDTGPVCSQFEDNHFKEMCSGSEAGSFLRLIDFVYHSTLGLGVIKKKKKTCQSGWREGLRLETCQSG